MTTAKEEFNKTISYIKRDIQDTEQDIKNVESALNFYMSQSVVRRVKFDKTVREVVRRVKFDKTVREYTRELDIYRNRLARYKRELKDFREYVNYSKSDVERIAPATDKELEIDLMKDKADLKRKQTLEYGEKESAELWAKVREQNRLRELEEDKAWQLQQLEEQQAWNKEY